MCLTLVRRAAGIIKRKKEKKKKRKKKEKRYCKKVCLEIFGIFKEPISKLVLEIMDVIEFIYNKTVLYPYMISCTIKKQSVH